MKTPLRFGWIFLLFASAAVFGGTPGKPEVPLTMAKALALSVAQQHLPEAELISATLYRNLEAAPAVWVFEFRAPGNDSPYTVVAAATRALPPVVMHWRGLPWHTDPEYLARARAGLAEYRRVDAKADWSDLRWEGPFDLWVPRTDGAEQQTFASVRDRVELTRADVASLSAEREARAAEASARVASVWSDIDRGEARLLEHGRPVAASPQYGFTPRPSS